MLHHLEHNLRRWPNVASWEQHYTSSERPVLDQSYSANQVMVDQHIFCSC